MNLWQLSYLVRRLGSSSMLSALANRRVAIFPKRSLSATVLTILWQTRAHLSLTRKIHCKHRDGRSLPTPSVCWAQQTMTTGRTHQCKQDVNSRRRVQLADQCCVLAARDGAHISHFRNEVPNAAKGRRRNRVPRLKSALCFPPCENHAVRHRKGNIRTEFRAALDP
jgi:hypothetical protein